MVSRILYLSRKFEEKKPWLMLIIIPIVRASLWVVLCDFDERTTVKSWSNNGGLIMLGTTSSWCHLIYCTQTIGKPSGCVEVMNRVSRSIRRTKRPSKKEIRRSFRVQQFSAVQHIMYNGSSRLDGCTSVDCLAAEIFFMNWIAHGNECSWGNDYLHRVLDSTAHHWFLLSFCIRKVGPGINV